MIIRFGVLSIVLVALTSCSDRPLPENVPAATVKSAIDPQPPLRTNLNVIKVSINDAAFFDWTLAPELKPDRLVVACPPKSGRLDGTSEVEGAISTPYTQIVFQTDLETRRFSLSGYDAVQFEIINADVIASTEIKCTFPRMQYKGDYSPDRAEKKDLLRDLAPIFETYIKDDAPGGSMTIWDHGQKIFDYSIGIEAADGRLRRTETPFDIASVTKEFTAFAVLKLIEDGRLSLDDPLEAFIPGLPNGSMITIYHLLTHTHGLLNYIGADGFDRAAQYKAEAAYSMLRELGPEFMPGSDYTYGNTSFRLLTEIIESVTNQSYPDFIRTELFAPAKMTGSYFMGEQSDGSRVQGFWQNEGEIVPYVGSMHVSQTEGIGNIVSTFDDLQKWYRALATGQIVSHEMFLKAATPQTLNDGTQIERGFGFFPDVIGDEIVIHNSGDGDTHTRYLYFTDQDRLIIINTNNSIQDHDYVINDIYSHVVGKVLDRSSYRLFGEDIELTDR
jgi:CubicO group peptidase (beta-lactamase class C family)